MPGICAVYRNNPMKTPLTGALPPSLLQRLKTWATLIHSKKTLQSHHEQAIQMHEKAEALMQRAKILHEIAREREHEQAAEIQEETAAKQ